MMRTQSFLGALILFTITTHCSSEEGSEQKPAELEALRASVGVWDAQIEVWPQGPEAESIRFPGVQTNRAFGEYWIASDFESDVNGQTVRVHTVIGYDLDKQKLVGLAIDHGPYAARMTGEYDRESKTITWETRVKSPDGQPIVQRTVVRYETPRRTVLVLSVPEPSAGQFIKFMEVKLDKRGSD